MNHALSRYSRPCKSTNQPVRGRVCYDFVTRGAWARGSHESWVSNDRFWGQKRLIVCGLGRVASDIRFHRFLVLFFFFNDFTMERFLDRVKSVFSFTIVRTTFLYNFQRGQNRSKLGSTLANTQKFICCTVCYGSCKFLGFFNPSMVELSCIVVKISFLFSIILSRNTFYLLQDTRNLLRENRTIFSHNVYVYRLIKNRFVLKFHFL